MKKTTAISIMWSVYILSCAASAIFSVDKDVVLAVSVIPVLPLVVATAMMMLDE